MIRIGAKYRRDHLRRAVQRKPEAGRFVTAMLGAYIMLRDKYGAHRGERAVAG